MAMRQRCDLHATCNGICNGCNALQVAAQTVRQPFRYRCARVAPPSRHHVSTASGPCAVRACIVLKQWPLLALRRGCKRTWYALSRYAAKYARNQYPGRQQSQVATPSHRLCSACASKTMCHRLRARRICTLAPAISGVAPIVGATPAFRFLIRDFPVLSPPSACTRHARVSHASRSVRKPSAGAGRRRPANAREGSMPKPSGFLSGSRRVFNKRSTSVQRALNER